jgi:hypothetical protein
MTFSDEAFKRAQAWVDDQRLTPLNAADRHRVIMARLRGAPTPQIDCFDVNFDGRSARIVLINPLVYVIEAGQPWAFLLEALPQRQATTASLWAAYLSHRQNPSLHAAPSPWPLHGWDSGAQKLLRQWREHEREALFSQSKIKPSLDTCLDADLLLDAWRAASPEANLRKMLAVALRQVREALPRPIRAALWRYKHRDGALAHWLMAGGLQGQTYRIQALHQQPLLLPMALRDTSQWPTPLPADQGDQESLSMQIQRGRALVSAIEEGQAWATGLPAILNAKSLPSPRQGVPVDRPLIHVTSAQVRLVGGQPPASALTSRLFDGAPPWLFFALESLVTLSKGRRPKTEAAWRSLLKIEIRCMELRWTDDDHVKHVPLTDGFFKGLPEDLADPQYRHLLSRWSLIADTFEWMADPHTPERCMAQVMDRLSWAQWNRFADRAHAMDEAMAPVRPRPDKHKQLRWKPLHPQGPWRASDGQTQVVELLSEWDLLDEGESMRHCVADYTVDCAMGNSRVFSVRNNQNQRLSTLELIWDDEPTDPRKVTVAQHFARKNFDAPLEARLAVAEFLAACDRFIPGPWPATRAGQARARADREAPDVSHRPKLRERLWEELERRYPLKRTETGQHKSKSMTPGGPQAQ